MVPYNMSTGNLHDCAWLMPGSHHLGRIYRSIQLGHYTPLLKPVAKSILRMLLPLSISRSPYSNSSGITRQINFLIRTGHQLLAALRRYSAGRNRISISSFISLPLDSLRLDEKILHLLLFEGSGSGRT